MKDEELIDLSYFPGCSLATTSQENNGSLIYLFRRLGYNLVELEDWNCCGSSSAHSVNSELAFDLASRNLSLAPEGRPLLVACPGCLGQIFRQDMPPIGGPSLEYSLGGDP